MGHTLTRLDTPIAPIRDSADAIIDAEQADGPGAGPTTDHGDTTDASA